MKEFEYKYGGMIFDSNSKPVQELGNIKITSEYGIGNLVSISEAITKMADTTLKLSNKFEAPEAVKEYSNENRSIGIKPGDHYSFNNILKSAAYYNAPDAAVMLAYILSPDPLTNLKKISNDYGLSEMAVENLSGRKDNTEQKHNIFDLLKIAQNVRKYTKFQISQLLPQILEIGNKVHSPSLRVPNTGRVIGVVRSNESVIFWFDYKNEIYSGAVIGHDSLAYDIDSYIIELIDSFIFKLDNKIKVIKEKNDNNIVNIFGDTYFGEFYTRRRIKKETEDALQKYGYNYSFENFESFLGNKEYNIINLETVLVSEEVKRSFPTMLTFYLDARPKETLDELKRLKINAVTTATNHTMDFGNEGAKSTLNWLDKYDIKTLGSGVNIIDSLKYMNFSTNNKNIYIFNSCVYSDRRFDMNYFASGNNPGATIFNQRLTEEIRKIKYNDPKSKIIMIPHWGNDFKPINSSQRNTAKRFFQAGGDLIVGHGPHMMQAVEMIEGKPSVFSIGNSVFNSNGEYTQREMPPYGFLTKLDISADTIKLYPIFINNLETFWKPRFINSEEVLEIEKWNKKWNSELEKIDIQSDNFGFYYELNF